MKELLELRKQMKDRKPNFARQNLNKHPKLKKKWRQPKGIQSKLRRKFGGHIKHPSPGFSSPKAVRHLHPSGLKPIIISNLNQLNKIKKEGIIISAKVGQKKKLELIKKIKELKLPLLNIKNMDEFIKQAEEKQKKKKEAQKKITEKKEEKEKEAQKKITEKKEEKTKEEKEKEIKEQKRKVLEAKQ